MNKVQKVIMNINDATFINIFQVVESSPKHPALFMLDAKTTNPNIRKSKALKISMFPKGSDTVTNRMNTGNSATANVNMSQVGLPSAAVI